MNDRLINFETAKLAFENGFNIETYNHYILYGTTDYELKVRHKNIYNGIFPIYLAPTQSLLQKWLRDVHKIHTYQKVTSRHNKIIITIDFIRFTDGRVIQGKEFENYEEALETGLYESLKLIKL